MHLVRKMPLGWLMLRRNPTRFVTAFLGVAASGVLILMQLVFQDALYQSSVSIVNKFDADLILLSKKSASLIGLASFPKERLGSVLRSPYVIEALPVRFRYVNWRLPGEIKSRLAIAIGVNPFQAVFTDQNINIQQKKLIKPGDILYDKLSRPEFGPVVKEFESGKHVLAYANTARLNVVGLISYGPSFGYDASFLTSISSVDQITDEINSSTAPIEIGVIKLADAVSPEKIVGEIAPGLPEDVFLMTKADFETSEKKYWDESKPIGFVFSFMTVMSLVVGATMVYQLLHMDVVFHLPSYAVLMSIGYKRANLEAIVFVQGVILSSFGFPVAWILSALLCKLVVASTSLPLNLTFNMVASTYLLLLFMCSTSALLAMTKLKDADPADLF